MDRNKTSQSKNQQTPAAKYDLLYHETFNFPDFFCPDEEAPPVDTLLIHRYVAGALTDEDERDDLELLIKHYRYWAVAYNEELREAGGFSYPTDREPPLTREEDER